MCASVQISPNADAKLHVGSFYTRRNEMGLGMILMIVLILALLGVIPTWPHSRQWGYYPSGGIGLVLLILVILLLLGRI